MQQMRWASGYTSGYTSGEGGTLLPQVCAGCDS